MTSCLMPLSSSDNGLGIDKHVARGKCLWHFDTTCNNLLDVFRTVGVGITSLQVVSVVDDIKKSQQDYLCSVLERAYS